MDTSEANISPTEVQKSDTFYLNPRSTYAEFEEQLTRKSTYAGIFAGLLMGIVLTIINAIDQSALGMKFTPILILGAVLYFVINDVKQFSGEGKTFKNGIKAGAITSIVAGLTLFVIGFILFAINPKFAPTLFGMASDTIGRVLTISTANIFLTFVGGMTFAFGWLQLKKDNATAR